MRQCQVGSTVRHHRNVLGCFRVGTVSRGEQQKAKQINSVNQRDFSFHNFTHRSAPVIVPPSCTRWLLRPIVGHSLSKRRYTSTKNIDSLIDIILFIWSTSNVSSSLNFRCYSCLRFQFLPRTNKTVGGGEYDASAAAVLYNK